MMSWRKQQKPDLTEWSWFFYVRSKQAVLKDKYARFEIIILSKL